jgi:hypothetical protein
MPLIPTRGRLGLEPIVKRPKAPSMFSCCQQLYTILVAIINPRSILSFDIVLYSKSFFPSSSVATAVNMLLSKNENENQNVVSSKLPAPSRFD